MSKHFLTCSALALFLIMPAVSSASSDREDDVNRAQRAATVFQEIMNAPDSIPLDVLNKAQCIAIVPGDKKFAFIFGADYGRGVAVCRTANGWGAPIFLAVEGGSFGYQIGGSSTDLILLFMNDHALHSLLSDKFKLGGDASVAAGPVGRNATAGTDLKLTAEILSYSRSKGIFAGVSLTGTVVQADKSGDEAMYGAGVSRHDILGGTVPPPPEAAALDAVIAKYSR
ncbi:MAG TPA: lipid-binding SYLF domain-containing protein [Candidatus Sulfotelmatobacter sp.]|jgi:SH3 domain-containing YSC84-like protein 1|nr:lipid-binding SYLF domain-containing protein [Candidatus Sulfotelmatobacter sp.]